MDFYFSADPHWGHANIITYCYRPFRDVVHMNEMLINNWNDVVPWDGYVYLLGDVFMGKADESWLNIRRRLNGKIHVIAGNHDNINKLYAAGIDYVTATQVFVSFNGITYWMAHHPVGYKERPDPGKTTYDISLTGHVHVAWKVKDNCINVGVDQFDYKPISLEQLEEVTRSIIL